MAFTVATLQLRGGAAGALQYVYTNTSDAMATVAASGYFNNTTYLSNFVAGDLLFCVLSDGNMWVRVSAVSSGAVTVQYAGGDLPILTTGTGTDSTLGSGIPTAGFAEVGSSISTATRFVLPTPYKGCVIHVNKVDSGTQGWEFDAGGSGATGITYDGSARRIAIKARSEGFRVRGTSTTRWRLEYLRTHDSAVSEGASVVFLGT